MYKIRITYSRNKDASYIKKEDIEEVFRQILIRANIKVTLNKDNTPILRNIDYLPIGITSTSEVVEVTLNEEYQIPFLIKELNLVSITGITILSARYIEKNSDISRNVYASKFVIEIENSNDFFNELTDAEIYDIKRKYIDKMVEFSNQEYILVLKKSKDRMERIDIKENILKCAKLSDLCFEVVIKKDEEIFDLINIYVSGIFEYIGKELNLSIKRTKIIFND